MGWWRLPGVQSDDQWLADSRTAGHPLVQTRWSRKVRQESGVLGRRASSPYFHRKEPVNTHAQPHPTALAQGSLGFASDPRIPPGPSVTIGASHMKAPSYLYPLSFPRAHWSLSRRPLPEGGVSLDGLLPEPISLRTETLLQLQQQDQASPHLDMHVHGQIVAGFRWGSE